MQQRIVDFGFLLGGAVIALGAGAAMVRSADLFMLLLVTLAGFIAVWCARKSASTLVGLAYVALTATLLVPGFEAEQQPRLTAWTAVALPILLALCALARERKIKVKLGLWSGGLLAFLTVLVRIQFDLDQVRFMVGISASAVLALAVVGGQVSTEAERRQLFVAGTVLAQLAAAIAIKDALAGTDTFSALFEQSKAPGVVYRASAFFGHPLILSTFLAAIVVGNMFRPKVKYPKIMTHWSLSIVLPLAGIAASASRSAVVVIPVGLVALLIAQRGTAHPGRTRTLWSATLLAGAAWWFINQEGNPLSRRYADLTMAEQYARLDGPRLVGTITTGMEQWIGAGPHAVAAAFRTGEGAARYGTVDNQYLSFYADYGMFGFAALVALSLTLLWGLRRRGIPDFARTWVSMGVVTIAAMFVFEPLAWPAVAIIFGYAVGCSSRSAIQEAGLVVPKSAVVRTPEVETVTRQ